VLSAGCSTDRLITRKNHNYDQQYCWQRIVDANDNTYALSNKLERDIHHFQILMEKALTQRVLGIKLINDIKNIDKQDLPIQPSMLEKLNVGMSRGLDLTDRVVGYVASNECWLQATSNTLAARNLKKIDPYTRYKGFLVAFSATLALYDTYYTTAYTINKNERVRQFLNQSDQGYGRGEDQLMAMTDTISNASNIRLVKKEIKFYEKNHETFSNNIQKDDNADYLTTLVKQSPTYSIIHNASI